MKQQVDIKPIGILNGGKTATVDGEFDCSKQGDIIYISFTNKGDTHCRLTFGGQQIEFGTSGDTLEFFWSYPYVDKTIYKYNFLPTAGGDTSGELQINFAKRQPYGE